MDTNINKVTREDLVKMVAEKTLYSTNIVKGIYDALESSIFESIASASEENDVLIKVFDGMTVEGIYQPEKTKLNNLTGKVIKTVSKIKPKATFTRTYCNRLCGK